MKAPSPKTSPPAHPSVGVARGILTQSRRPVVAQLRPEDPPPGMRMCEVTAITGLSRSSIYNMLRTGAFVRPFKVGTRSVRFLRIEVEEWLAQRIAQRDVPGEY